MRLTQAIAEAATLPEGKDDLFVYDDAVPEYALRIRHVAGGRISKNWTKGYRFAGQPRRITIGPIEIVKEHQARKRASDIHAMVRLGRDPKAEAIEEKTQAADIFERLLKPYLARKLKEVRPESYQEISRYLNQHLRPLHRLPIKRIDQRLVAARIAEIAITSGSSAAKGARSNGSAFFTHLMRNGIAASNPFANVEVPKVNDPRDRKLDDVELQAINSELLPDDDFSQILTILFHTGQRRSEIGNLEWTEVDLDKAIITLPGRKTKNHQEHAFPISAPVLDILKRRPRTWQDGSLRKFVFGRLRSSGFTAFSRGKRELDARITKARGAPLRPWRLHDVRRSIVTRLHDDLDIPPHVVEAIVNHISGHKGGIAGVYNYAKYARQMRAALNAWAEHLAAILEGRKPQSNVVTMKAAS
jgi:integrase